MRESNAYLQQIIILTIFVVHITLIPCLKMKTIEERTRICITCKHKDFDPSCGIVCGLTKAKATFCNECPDYDKDEMQIKELAEKSKIQQDSIGIKGWFAIFLWVGMGGYSLLPLIVAAVNAIGSGFSAAFSLMYLSMVSVMFSVAVCAIIAFYRRRPNAVALATTYIIMIVADGALQFIVSLILNDGSLMPPIRRILWGIGWFLFLQKSDDVEDLIPVISRAWGRFEKIALAVFAVATVATVATAASARFSDTAHKSKQRAVYDLQTARLQ